jgi:hypothetical protein
MARTENFLFGVTPIGACNLGGTMVGDATANQTISTVNMLQRNPDIGDIVMEPAEIQSTGQAINLDSHSRIIISAWKDSAPAGAGPVARIGFFREGAAEEFAVELGQIGQEPSSVIVTSEFPPNFGKNDATPVLDDSLRVQLRADGNGVANRVTAVVLIVPPAIGAGGRGTSRGNQLSGPGYY